MLAAGPLHFFMIWPIKEVFDLSEQIRASLGFQG